MINFKFITPPPLTYILKLPSSYMHFAYEAGYRETNVRGGSTSLVVQFLQEMRDPGSEQRNPREIP